MNKGSGGNVRQRSNGAWEGRYRQDGRQRSVYARTRAECQAKLRLAMQRAETGRAPTDNRLTVADWLETWLDTSCRGKLQPTTVWSYEDTVRRSIVPAIGRIRLASLTPEDVNRMLALLADRRPAISPTTQRYAYSVLRIALGRAVKSERVDRNVATLVDPPAKSTPEMHPLSAHEARGFLDAVAGERLGPLYALAVYTGLRQGELLALRWQDVKLETATLSVRHTLRRHTHELSVPKTERSKRTLRLGVTALAALREQRRRQLEERLAAGRRWQDRDLVFTSHTGGALNSTDVTKMLKDALARYGFRRQRFHDLRHAYATLMIEDGEELAVVSRSLGHSQLSTTADVYAHLTPVLEERSAARIDSIFARREAASG